MIDSERVRADVFTKSDPEGWPVDPMVVSSGCETILHSIEATIPIAAIYADSHQAGAAK